jgi:hypothetical protein
MKLLEAVAAAVLHKREQDERKRLGMDIVWTKLPFLPYWIIRKEFLRITRINYKKHNPQAATVRVYVRNIDTLSYTYFF